MKRRNPYTPTQEPDEEPNNYLEIRIESSAADYLRITADLRNDTDPDRPWRQPDAISGILACGMKITAQADRTQPEWYAVALRHEGTVLTAAHARAIVAAFDRYDRQREKEYNQGLSHEHPAAACAAWMRIYRIGRWTVRDTRQGEYNSTRAIVAAGTMLTLREMFRALDRTLYAHQHPQPARSAIGWTAADDVDRAQADTVPDPRD